MTKTTMTPASNGPIHRLVDRLYQEIRQSFGATPPPPELWGVMAAFAAREELPLSGMILVPVCGECGKRPASCLGQYDDHNADSCEDRACTQHQTAFACDECCGHGNEDGGCRPLEPGDWSPAIPTFDPMRDVEEFHRRFLLEYSGPPRMLDPEMAKFRREFLEEEGIQEYCKAMTMAEYWVGMREGGRALRRGRVTDSLAQCLDALVDTVYVALGNAHLHGFDFREAFRRVHAANMAKVRAARPEDSVRGTAFDVVKPPGWAPPDLKDLVDTHTHGEEK